MNPAREWLGDPSHPICCDTSALYHPGVLRCLRQSFPERRMLLPVVAYFERQRQLRVRWGAAYRPEVLRQGLLDPLQVEIASCEESIALLLARITEQVETRALGALTGSQTWPDERSRREAIQACAREMRVQQVNWKPLLEGQSGLALPCGQQCRLGDYTVAATACAYNALLLTDDRGLLDSADRYPDLFPPTLPPDLSV
jgi:predicted nucleic acid-binding protein